MKKILVYLLVMIAGLVLVSCNSSDQKIQKNIESKISSQYPDVKVHVSDKVATLEGMVNMESQRTAVENEVKSVKEVKSVINNIKTPQLESSVKVDSDAVIKGSIRSSLYAAGYDDVNVDVRDGEVYLTGSIKRNDLQNVMQFANESNPKRVVNQLKIEE